MTASGLVTCGIAAAPAGIALVRRGWSRSRAIALAGWTLAGFAVALGGASDGAWGVAVVVSAGMLAAGAALALAAIRSRRGHARPAREPASIALPRLRDMALLRRMATFLMVAPVGFAAAQMLAFGMQAAMRRAGWGEANVLALMLFAQPAAWAVLATVQMTRPRWTRMIVPAAAFAGMGGLLWWPA